MGIANRVEGPSQEIPSFQQQQLCNGVVTASTAGHLQAISEHAFTIKNTRSAW